MKLLTVEMSFGYGLLREGTLLNGYTWLGMPAVNILSVIRY